MNLNQRCKIPEVLILAGGRGTRLASVVTDAPKPLAQIAGKPFLHYLFDNLVRQKIANAKILAGYKSEMITESMQCYQDRININFLIEHQPLGTGGALYNAIKSSAAESFIVINGDTYFDIPFSQMAASGTPHAVALCRMSDVGRYGSVSVDSDSFVTQFNEKSSQNLSGLINAGVYFLHRSVLDVMLSGSFSLEKEVLPCLAEAKQLRGIEFDVPFLDIGIPEDYKRAQALIPKWHARRSEP